MQVILSCVIFCQVGGVILTGIESGHSIQQLPRLNHRRKKDFQCSSRCLLAWDVIKIFHSFYLVIRVLSSSFVQFFSKTFSVQQILSNLKPKTHKNSIFLILRGISSPNPGRTTLYSKTNSTILREIMWSKASCQNNTTRGSGQICQDALQS